MVLFMHYSQLFITISRGYNEGIWASNHNYLVRFQNPTSYLNRLQLLRFFTHRNHSHTETGISCAILCPFWIRSCEIFALRIHSTACTRCTTTTPLISGPAVLSEYICPSSTAFRAPFLSFAPLRAFVFVRNITWLTASFWISSSKPEITV